MSGRNISLNRNVTLTKINIFDRFNTSTQNHITIVNVLLISNTQLLMEPISTINSNQPSYWLTRFVILRLLGIIYAVAFLVAINQIIPLIGTKGLLPLGIYLKQIPATLGSTGAGFVRLPSVFWFWHSDTALLTVAWLGLLLSCVVIIGYANVPLLTIIWLLYMSIVHVGQDWYG